MSGGFEALGDGRFRVTGAMNFETVPALWEQSRAPLDGGDTVTIDLAGVTEVDSAGLALVIEWLRQAEGRGRKLALAGAPEGLKALARISEVEDFIL